MLRFSNQNSYVEVDLARFDGDAIQDALTRDDAYITVQVSSAGISGHNDLWVSASTLRAFCVGLVALERDRRGDAFLESIVPNELFIKVRSIDGWGHMAVAGSTGYDVGSSNFSCWHAVHFGFEFDPAQLVEAARVDWVRQAVNASEV